MNPLPPIGRYSPARHLRYGDERFQDAPGWPEYPAFDVDIVSCALPSGVAWLFSCLLEMRVAAWKPWNADTRLEWQPRGELAYRYWCPGDPWSRLAPALVSGREFAFKAQPVPRYMHGWPGAHPACPRTILVVRDPRDALYSAWRRDEADRELDGDSSDRFIAYANGCDPGFDYRRAEYWDRFHTAWLLHLADKEHIVVRFEDFKRRPLAALDLICRFLGLAVDPDESIRAAAMSSFDNVLRVDHGLVSRGVFDRPINRAGAVEEYRTTFSAAMHGVFSHADLATWWTLGYGAFDT